MRRLLACLLGSAVLAGTYHFPAIAQALQNTITLVSVPSGERPRLECSGPDTDVYCDDYAKGDGAHVFRGWGGGAHAFVAYAQDINGQNFLEAHGTVGPPQLRATGPSANVSLYLRPQNSGVVLARNAVELVTEENGNVVTIGFVGAHKAIFGGDSNDLVIRAETGIKIRFFIGGTEAAPPIE